MCVWSRPVDIADEHRAILISRPSRIRNQTISFVSLVYERDKFINDARSLDGLSFLGFCLFEVEGRKTHYDAKLTPRFAHSVSALVWDLDRLSFTTSSGYWSFAI